MSVKRSLSLALGSALFLCPTSVWANGSSTSSSASAGDSDALTLNPAPVAASAAQGPNDRTTPLYLAAAAPEAPNIHGFANISFGTSYITPRGLVVENSGVVIQPVFGIVLPIGDIGFLKNFTLVGGIWNCITTNQNDEAVGSWNEMDVFFSASADIFPQVNATLTYGSWNFPQSTLAKPETEHNIDLKISYADKWFGPNFALNPYVDLFWAVEGSSTVVLGKQGETGYIEVGVVPTFKVNAVKSYPMTVTIPTYFSFGPSEYWGGDNNFGVASTAVNVSVPLTAIIPARYGNWHVDFGVQYYHLLNGTLLDAGTILSGNTDRNLFRGYVGFGFSF